MPDFHPASRFTSFCSECGHATTRMIPHDDHHMRDVCLSCGAIHYVNPLPVVGTIARRDGKILLCRRAIEPAYNKWTLPAGFMELHETTLDGAIRETREEAGASVHQLKLFSLINVPEAGQIHFYYLADLINDHIEAGEESLEVRLFHPDEIPWDELSFPTVIETLKRFLQAPDQLHQFDL